MSSFSITLWWGKNGCHQKDHCCFCYRQLSCFSIFVPLHISGCWNVFIFGAWKQRSGNGGISTLHMKKSLAKWMGILKPCWKLGGIRPFASQKMCSVGLPTQRSSFLVIFRFVVLLVIQGLLEDCFFITTHIHTPPAFYFSWGSYLSLLNLLPFLFLSKQTLEMKDIKNNLYIFYTHASSST